MKSKKFAMASDEQTVELTESQTPFWYSYAKRPAVLDVTCYELATLAARLSNTKSYKHPNGAVGAAIALINGAAGAIELLRSWVEEDKKQKPSEEPLEDLLKRITREKRQDRVMPKMKKFIAAHGFDKTACARQIKLMREKSLNGLEVDALRRAYDGWARGIPIETVKWMVVSQPAGETI